MKGSKKPEDGVGTKKKIGGGIQIGESQRVKSDATEKTEEGTKLKGGGAKGPPTTSRLEANSILPILW